MNSKKLFIHIPKNAGLTVRRFHQVANEIILPSPGLYVSKSYTDRLNQTMQEAGEHHGHEHARWRDIHKQFTDQYQSFAVVRNPWTRVGSRYMFGLRAVEKERAPKGYMPNSFEEFLEERHEYGNKEFYWHRAVRGWYQQLDYVIDHLGDIKCDILRFEHFEEDLRKYFDISDSVKIKSSNNFHRGNTDPNWAKWDIDYRTLYNDKTIQIVADWYKDDIEKFGFTFYSTATKNIWDQL